MPGSLVLLGPNQIQGATDYLTAHSTWSQSPVFFPSTTISLACQPCRISAKALCVLPKTTPKGTQMFKPKSETQPQMIPGDPLVHKWMNWHRWHITSKCSDPCTNAESDVLWMTIGTTLLRLWRCWINVWMTRARTGDTSSKYVWLFVSTCSGT